MPKLLFIGDPHIRVDNIPEVNLFIERIQDLANREKPDLICVGGDVLHTHERLHTTPLNKAYELIKKLRVITQTFVLVGNHDYIHNGQYLSENHWLNSMKEWDNVVIVDKVIHHYLDDVHLIFVPYVPPGRFQEALNTNEEEWDDADCILAHQEFYGCKMGAIVSVEGDKWPEDYPEVVSGHIHSNQRPQSNIYYPGSAMQNAFGESEKNIIAVMTWEGSGEKYELKEHDLQLPRKKIVYKDITDMDDYNPDKSADKVKITVSGVYDEFKAFKKTKKYKELVKSGTKVVFKAKKSDIKKEREQIDEIDETDFNKILYTLVKSEKNSELYKAHELVVNNKDVSKEYIIFS